MPPGWNPRHIEGVEHFFFYNLERRTGRHFIHGQPVGLGIVARSSCMHGAAAQTRWSPRWCASRRRHPARGDGRDVGRRGGRDAHARQRSCARRGCGTRSPTSGRSTTRSWPRCASRIDAAYGPWEGGLVKVGITLPQGCDREYLGLDGPAAWARTVEAARRAETLGFESLWLYDHFQVDPPLDRCAGLRAVRRADGDRRP